MTSARSPKKSPSSDVATVESLGLELAKITPELRERFELGDETERRGGDRPWTRGLGRREGPAPPAT